MPDFGLEVRKEVLGRALFLEAMTSGFLMTLLDIKDMANSSVFGNKSGCLSFNQKIDLLIEMGSLSFEDRSKFKAFMEIRNQFMHNIDAKNYELCFKHLEGKEKYILRLYKQDDKLPKEEQLLLAVKQLMEELLQLTTSIIIKVKEKLKHQAEREVLEMSQKAAFKAIDDLKDGVNGYFKDIIEKERNLTAKDLEWFGDEVKKLLIRFWKRNLQQLQKESEEKEKAQ